MSVTIGLITPYNGENLGDAAIQEAVIWNLTQRLENAEFIGFSLDPDETALKHGIRFERYSAWSASAGKDSSPTSASRARRIWNECTHFFESWRHARNVDALIVSGGGQLDEFWGGAREHPLTLLKWSIVARLSATPFIILSVGHSKLETRSARFFIYAALRFANYRSYRDSKSKKALLARAGFVAKDPVTPDLAFSLPESMKPRHNAEHPTQRVVGICPMAFKDPRRWPEKDGAIYELYISRLSSIAAGLIRRGNTIAVFGTAYRQDAAAVDDLLASIASIPDIGHLPPPFCPPVNSVTTLLEAMSSCQNIVVSRLHGAILGHWLAIPTIALSYDPKVDILMRSLDRTHRNFDIEAFSPEGLVDAIEEEQSSRGATVAAISRKTSSFRIELDRQYDTLLEILNND
jgi:polysaccharide pyruvyl transferase WcaK-like protein